MLFSLYLCQQIMEHNIGEIKNVPSSAKIIAVMSSKALDETFSNDSIKHGLDGTYNRHLKTQE